MNRKLQLLYLIELYCFGKYDTNTFSSNMARIYYIERDDSLSQKEINILAPLAHCADYYSPYQMDHDQYQGFTNEEDVKQAATEAYNELLRHYRMDSFEKWIKQALDDEYSKE